MEIGKELCYDKLKLSVKGGTGVIPELIGYTVLGLISGFSELLPVSASGNARLFTQMLGLDGSADFVRLFIRIGTLAALILRMSKQLGHLYRENRLARIPVKRRRRSPDIYAVLDGRVIAGAMLPMAVGLVLCWLFRSRLAGMPLAVIGLAVSGLMVYIPQFFPGGNRDSRGMSRLDGWLLGLASGLAVLTGLSRIGGILCVGQLRGCDSKYILDMGLMLSVPTLALLVILDVLSVIMAGFAAVSFVTVLGAVLAASAAFAACYGAISIARHLAVGAGFTAFAYVNWGLAMFGFILYLMT